MSKKVRVILLEDVENYGRAGEIVEVSEGYARNFLFSQGKAALATNQVEKQVEKKQAKVAEVEKKELAKYRKRADELDGTEIVIVARLKDGDEIYGKINKKDIVKELKAQADLEVVAKDMDLDEPITKLGTYNVVIGLSGDVETNMKVTIEADPDSLPKNQE